MEDQERALVAAQPQQLWTWEQIKDIGMTVHQARTFGVHTGQEAAIKMLTAYEHGIPLTSALSAVYVIDNKPALAPKLMWAKVVGHPDFEGYEEKRLEDAKGNFGGWEITLKRRGWPKISRRFSLADAQRIIVNVQGKRLIDKDNWQNYPEPTCYWRAMGLVIDAVFPDVAQGLYRANELGAGVTPEGDVIEGSWQSVAENTHVVATGPVETVKADEQPQVNLDDLLTQYGPEAIMAANNGMIPATDQEVAQVAEVLANGDN